MPKTEIAGLCPLSFWNSDLHHSIPACALHGGLDEFGADVPFAEVFFVHAAIRDPVAIRQLSAF
jgi:hypothetical protein